MTYINTGAEVNNKRPASKKALKEALAAEPASVTFDGTAAFGPGADVTYFAPRLHELPAGTKLSVCGPDPHTSRKWYATVEVVNGKIKVS